MVSKHKRKILTLLFALIFILSFGCSSIPSITQDEIELPFDGLSVHYIDVGQGDSILICLPDGKCMLIDCGNGSDMAIDNISAELSSKDISSIDYLVLTHPDFDHIGGALGVLNNISVKKVYHSDIAESKVGFEDHFALLSVLNDSGAENEISVFGEALVGEYKIAFLSPKPRFMQGSSYRDFNLAIEPTDTQINNLSPYIYLEYKGVRFLFTGDAGNKQEQALISDYEFIKQTFSRKEVSVVLENIDFLKVAHHGSEDCSSYEFISLLNPKNAIISVGGRNNYGHPATNTLKRLNMAELYRTDVYGTISVYVDTNGITTVKTQRQTA